MQYDENAEKYGYEGEMTTMKCDELKAHKAAVAIPSTELLRMRTPSMGGKPQVPPQQQCGISRGDDFLHVQKNGVMPYDKNLTNYPKETKELLKLCKKACERIAKEVA